MKQNTVFSPILALFILAACTKGVADLQPQCQPVCLLSDKYSPDTVFLKTDTLWKDGNLCGAELERVRAMPTQYLTLCSDRTFEIWRYVIGKIITHPKIF